MKWMRFVAAMGLAVGLAACTKDSTCKTCSTDSDCSTGQTCKAFENTSTGARSFRCAAPSATSCTTTASGGNPLLGPSDDQFSTADPGRGH